MTPQDDDYLSERLREAQDTVSLSHRQPGGQAAQSGSVPEGQVVERVTEVQGEAHLGGRKVRDRFIRSGSQAPTPAAPARATTGREATGPGGALDPYLEARLKEIQDQAPKLRSQAQPDVTADAVDTYRALRRQLGGG